MNQYIPDPTHPLEELYVHENEEPIMPRDICTDHDLAHYYLQRLPGITSIPVLRGSEETMATITPLLDALAAEDPKAFQSLLILPFEGGFLLANHIEHEWVGYVAITSFLRNATTDAQRLFAKQFTISTLRTQLLRCEWVAKGKPICALSEEQINQPLAILSR
jgi:hypothetical protein